MRPTTCIHILHIQHHQLTQQKTKYKNTQILKKKHISENIYIAQI